MREVRELAFAESVASLVEELVQRVEEQVGTTHLFTSQKHFGGSLKFALRRPEEQKGKKAVGLFFIIYRCHDGAVIHKPRPVKVGHREFKLTQATFEDAFKLAMSGFHQVKKMKVPVEYEATENRLVLAGGQFESKRSKH